MTRIAAMLAVVLLSGCGATARYACTPSMVDVHVAQECHAHCAIDTGTITEDPNTIIIAAHDAVTKCEARRALCESALKRAQDAGVIR